MRAVKKEVFIELNCENFEAVLSEYIDGEMNEHEVRRMEGHALLCADCNGTLTGVLQVRTALSGLGEMHPPARFRLGLFGFLHENFSHRRGLWARPMALSLALVAALTILLWPEEQELRDHSVAWDSHQIRLGDRLDQLFTAGRPTTQFSQAQAHAVSF